MAIELTTYQIPEAGQDIKVYIDALLSLKDRASDFSRSLGRVSWIQGHILLRARDVLVQRELDNPSIVLSNSPAHAWRGSCSSSLPPAGVLGLGSGTAGGRPFRPVASTPPGTG